MTKNKPTYLYEIEAGDGAIYVGATKRIEQTQGRLFDGKSYFSKMHSGPYRFHVLAVLESSKEYVDSTRDAYACEKSKTHKIVYGTWNSQDQLPGIEPKIERFIQGVKVQRVPPEARGLKPKGQWPYITKSGRVVR